MNVLIASIRRQFENGEIPKEILVELYRAYNGMIDVPLFIDRSRNLFPRLNCGVASLYLQHVLGCGCVVQGKYAGYNHTFLQLDNNHIVDISADQYGGPPIYVGPLIQPWEEKQ